MSTALLNLAEVAARLGVSRTTSWRLISSGLLPSVEILPGLRRVDPEDLERFIQERRQHAPSAKVVELHREDELRRQRAATKAPAGKI